MVAQTNRFEVERAKGIEPSCAVWKTAVLPLNYARVRANDSPRAGVVNAVGGRGKGARGHVSGVRTGQARDGAFRFAKLARLGEGNFGSLTQH